MCWLCEMGRNESETNSLCYFSSKHMHTCIASVAEGMVLVPRPLEPSGYHEPRYSTSLQWCHNEHDGVSNHQPRDCLLSRLFMRRSKKTSKFRVTGLCEGNSPGAGEFPAQRASNAENISIWWHHHVHDKCLIVFNTMEDCNSMCHLRMFETVNICSCFLKIISAWQWLRPTIVVCLNHPRETFFRGMSHLMSPSHANWPSSPDIIGPRLSAGWNH